MDAARRDKVAIATCAAFPQGAKDDAPVAEALRDLGLEAEVVQWDADVAWGQYGAVLLRSTWDYHRRPETFLSWLDRLDREGVPCVNPTSTVRWNHHKHYLADLGQKGIQTIPTLWLEKGAAVDLASLARRVGTPEIIVKPCVSASSDDTFRIPRNQVDAFQARVSELVARRETMVQPFVAEVLEGELSYMWIDGRVEHAAHKRPGPQDFRVQLHHGGIQVPVDVRPDWAKWSDAVVAASGREIIYARVDFIVTKEKGPILVELEAIEPDLFFRYSPTAARRLADAVVRRLSLARA